MPLLFAISLVCFCASISARVLDPMVPAIARDLLVAPATAALLASAFAFPFAFGQPLLGPLGDALGKARVIKGCLAVLTLALGASALAADFGQLFVARIASGVASGGISPLAFALVADRVPPARRQVALSRVLAAALVGQLAGAIGSGLIAARAGWRLVLALAATATLIALLVAVLKLAPRPGAVRTRFTLAGLRTGYRKVFANPRAPICYGTVFTEGLAIFGVMPFVALMLEANQAGGMQEAGFVLAGLGIGGLVFTSFIGFMLSRVGTFGLIRYGGLLAGSGLAAAALVHSWPAEFAAFTLIGLGFYMMHNSVQNQVMELAPDARGAAVSMHAFSFFLGQASGPVVYGFGASAIGLDKTLLIAAAVVGLLGIVSAAAFINLAPSQD